MFVRNVLSIVIFALLPLTVQNVNLGLQLVLMEVVYNACQHAVNAYLLILLFVNHA